MDSLETRLAQARERLTDEYVIAYPPSSYFSAGDFRAGFDAAANIAREVVAEKELYIRGLASRLESFKAQVATWRSIEQERRDEIARLEAQYDSAFRSPNEIRERLNAVEPRKVSDAQREAIRSVLLSVLRDVDGIPENYYRLCKLYAERICAIIELHADAEATT